MTDTPESLLQPTILIVDDSPESVRLLHALLEPNYRTMVARSGERALELVVQTPPPDLILLDVLMPGMDGYAVCEALKASPATADIAVIFLTSRIEVADEQRGLDLGAVDYLSKPISAPLVLARIRTHLALKAANDRLKNQNQVLEAEVLRRSRQLTVIQDVTIRALASLAETRDNETGNHILRTQNYVRALALRLRHHPRFASALDDEAIDLLYKSAPLHDIGKVGIPDHILLKPGKLTDEEFEIMKTHTTLGRQALERAERSMEGEVEFLRYAKEIAQSHQEKWDGSGYPEGLAGDAIPLSARLMAVADVYDALISRRVYKPAFSHELAVRMITEQRGRHFDPDITDAFTRMADEFRGIAGRFSDD